MEMTESELLFRLTVFVLLFVCLFVVRIFHGCISDKTEGYSAFYTPLLPLNGNSEIVITMGVLNVYYMYLQDTDKSVFNYT